MDWLCDEMLGRLARLLRAAGHDAALASGGTPDRTLLDQAGAEKRILLTRDRRLACAVGAGGGLVDNSPLRPASPAEAIAAPAEASGPFNRCPACGRLCWSGGHARRLAATLDRLARTAGP